MASAGSINPFSRIIQDVPGGGGVFYSLPALKDDRIRRLPFSIRVLLEAALRNCDEFSIKSQDVENILNWEVTAPKKTEVPFRPSRVLLQDFTGVPAVVDFAAMRDAMARLKGDPKKINPLVPVDLVVDHSVQVDSWGSRDALERNEKIEYERNAERFAFLKWGSISFNNFGIVPPGSGIVHQVNLEYLARVVFEDETAPGASPGRPLVYPDSVVGTDSHTTMIDGLGVVGWGVGGIEAEAVMLGQAISMVLPEVVGMKLTGGLPLATTATDLVLTITERLRKRGVVGKFVEFFGPGCQSLTLADRATIANMSPEYGATMGFFPVDEQSLEYLRQSGRDQQKISMVERYLKAQELFRTYDGAQPDPVYSGDILVLDLATVESCVSGPKRPHDLVLTKNLKSDFLSCLTSPTGFKGYGLPADAVSRQRTFNYLGSEHVLRHGTILIAAITSCTNTSNPSVMLGAGLLAKNALAKGLKVPGYVKCSLAPGSGVVESYLRESGLLPSLEDMGFFLVGFGCTTCIGNSGDLAEEVVKAVGDGDIVSCSVLSGNRNFEGRVHALTAANFLMSPMLVVAYALCGNVITDLQTDPLGIGNDGKPVYLRDIWPERKQLADIESKVVSPALFKECYKNIREGNDRWRNLEVTTGELYKWDKASTYINNPPFFSTTTLDVQPIKPINNAYCLLNVGDSVTTDHISPAGKIARDSPAAVYLQSRNVGIADFNTYGARRGNDEVMARGTFANIRLVNKLAPSVGPKTTHVPSGEVMAVYDAAQKYIQAGQETIILAGKEYGSGSSRDWAAKGPYLQGVRAVLAESFERIHRSNLVGMGILPLQYKEGETSDTHGLTGKETFSFTLDGGSLSVAQLVHVTTNTGKTFSVVSRVDTEVEAEYYKHGGILHFVLRKLAKS
eukprot:Lankesteria_metandrocarpae@DN6103_c0_g1_i1.p1